MKVIFRRILWMGLLFKTCKISRIKEPVRSLMLCVLFWESCNIHPWEAAQGEGSGSSLSYSSCLLPPLPLYQSPPDISGSMDYKTQIGAWLWIELEKEVDIEDHTSQLTGHSLCSNPLRDSLITDQWSHLDLGFSVLPAAAPQCPLPCFSAQALILADKERSIDASSIKYVWQPLPLWIVVKVR